MYMMEVMLTVSIWIVHPSALFIVAVGITGGLLGALQVPRFYLKLVVSGRKRDMESRSFHLRIYQARIRDHRYQCQTMGYR